MYHESYIVNMPRFKTMHNLLFRSLTLEEPNIVSLTGRHLEKWLSRIVRELKLKKTI